MPTRVTKVFFIVVVGERFDIGASPPGGPWFTRLLWWLIGTSAAALLGYGITKLLP